MTGRSTPLQTSRCRRSLTIFRNTVSRFTLSHDAQPLLFGQIQQLGQNPVRAPISELHAYVVNTTRWAIERVPGFSTHVYVEGRQTSSSASWARHTCVQATLGHILKHARLWMLASEHLQACVGA